MYAGSIAGDASSRAAPDRQSAPGAGNDVADQLLPGRGVDDEHRGLRDLRACGEQRRLDLAELDALTAELDLEVGAADVVEVAPSRRPGRSQRTRSPVRYIRSAGAAERVGDEAIRRQIRATEVAARELATGEVQLAGRADWRLGRSRESST